jgi:cysteine desulfurase
MESILRQIYLDHNATTPIDPDVIKIMEETARVYWANPSSGHPLGSSAREELQRRRSTIGRFIGARPREIVFTAGGTESDNLALIGTAHALQDKGRHILISSVEHHAILESCEILHQHGFDITKLPVDRTGRVDPEDLRKGIRKDTILVSVMHANNEVGTIQPIEEIGRIAREKGILFHTDAAQSIGKVPVHVDEMGVDLLTCSSHKIYGPKGTGFLYIREGTPIRPLIVGGGQEGGVRAGTENLPSIAGLSRALEIAGERMHEEARVLTGLRETLWQELSRRVDGLHMHGHPQERLPGTLSLYIEGIRSSDLIAQLNQQGVCLSASAACTTESVSPSHVLSAMGVSLEGAAGTLRISLGRSNSGGEIPQVAEAISVSVNHLRRQAS